MSLARVLLTRLATGQASGTLLAGRAGLQQALVALQHQLPSSSHHASGFIGLPSTGGSRGFAAGGSAGGGGGDPAQQQPQAGKQEEQEQQGAFQQQQAPPTGATQASHQQPQPQQQGSTKQQQAEQQAGQQPPSEPQQQQQQQQAPPQQFDFSSNNPELKKYIEGLKQLKSSTTVQRQEVGGDPTWWQQLIQATLGNWIEGWIRDFLRVRIERDFDVEEFVDGAKDAFWIVNRLLGEEDWDTLKPMMSAKMLAALKDTVEAYKADGLVWRTELVDAASGGVDLQGGIRGMGFLTKQQLADYDAERAAAEDSGQAAMRPAGMWLVLTVQLRADQKVTITRQDDGLVVAELRDKRPVRWKFATGPLPGNLPIDRLETDWFLLTIA